jgi:hypothetical protein
MGATGMTFADTLTEEFGGGVAHSPGNNEMAWLDVDVQNSPLIEIRTDRDDSAATATVIYQLGESPLQWTMARGEPILWERNSGAAVADGTPIALTIAPDRPFTLLQCRLHISGAVPGATSLLTATMDSGINEYHDTLLTSEDMTAANSIVVSYGDNYKFAATDEVDFSYENQNAVGARDLGLEVAYKLNLP